MGPRAAHKALRACRVRHTDTRSELEMPSALGADQSHPVHPGTLPRGGLSGERAPTSDEAKRRKLDVVLGPIRAIRREHEVIALQGPAGGAMVGQVGLP